MASSSYVTVAQATPVVRAEKAQGLWTDAVSRLLQNRAATASLLFIGALLLVAAAAPWLAPYAYDAQHLDRTWQSPSAQHLLGTDAFGRDVLSRLIYGARVSLTVAIIAQAIILVIGVPLGLLAGYFGGWVDNAIMRVVDALFSLPDVLIVIVLMAFIKQGLGQANTGPLGAL